MACAIALALRNVAVTVFDPRALPIDKPCGEGIMPEGVAQLKKLGVFDYLDRHDSSFFRGVCFINERGSYAFSEFGNAYGLGCRRLALSRALYHRCCDFPLIKFTTRKFHKLEFGSQSITVAGHEMRIVIGADGLRSRVRAWAGLKGAEAQIQRYGLRQHFAVKPWSDYVEVYFRRGVEAYITPCGMSQTNVTFLWSKDLLTEPISFAALLNLFPEVATRIRNKTPVSEQMAIGPLRQHCHQVIGDGIALVGDASGYYDAITGEGISLSLRQADALAQTLTSALSTTKRGLIRLEDYATKHRAIIRPYYRNTALLLWLARRPRLMSKVIDFGDRRPRTFAWMLEASRKLS